MRKARLRVDNGKGHGTYYHVYNHAIGSKSDRPFGDLEKEKLVELIQLLDRSLALQVIGYAVMGNHYHVVLYAPHAMPDEPEAIKGYKLLYGPRRPLVTADSLMTWRQNSRDLSFFCFQLQIRFTTWFNRKRGGERRTGTIWNDRFKSTILEGDKASSAVWSCLKYVELNPVRAKIVSDPGEYRWCSWGAWRGSGVHPCAAAFRHHLTALKGCVADNWGEDEVFVAFEAEMQRTMRNDENRQAEYDRLVALPRTKEIAEEIGKLDRDDGGEPSIWVRTDRRVRYWADGAAIGSRRFIQGLFERFFPDAKKQPQFVSGSDSDPNPSLLLAMKRKRKSKTNKSRFSPGPGRLPAPPG